jgi:PAS domain S-box-containing protein
MDNISLGLVLIIIGVGLLALTPVLLRFLPRGGRKKPEPVEFQPVLISEIEKNENAVLLVQAGGRVTYLNSLAREWFGLGERDAPNLERLARRTRPADVFLSLCAEEGKTRFTLNQMLVEGNSCTLPYQGERAVLVSITRPQLTSLETGEDSLSSQAVAIFTEISQAMSASLELETTIETILESIDRLIPSDFSEITLWNAESAHFVPYRYLVEQDGVRRLSRHKPNYTLDKGFTGYLASQNEALVVPDVMEFHAARPAVSRAQIPLRSYLGIPLKIGGQLVGTIELGSQQADNFAQQDKAVLDILSRHAAVALQNAVTHHKEHERVREMSGLAELAQVSRSIQSIQNLYREIIETIAPLIEVDILGFLIYDEDTRILKGQVPFRGFPEQFTELYQTKIEENTPAERIWAEQDIIITDDMGEDSILDRLGLAPLAQASAMRETVLVPLSAGARYMGYLQAANKSDGSEFNDDDLRLLRIIAGQISPILENANLIQQSRRRTQRAEALRRVASLAGSEATQDEALQFSLLELSRLLGADVAAVLLLDDSLGILQIHENSTVGLSEEAIGKLSLHFVTQASLNNTVTETRTGIATGDLMADEQLAQPYQALQPRLTDIHSLVVEPLVARGRSLGEILIGSTESNFFDINDQQSLETAAGQIASAIERASLITQTDEDLQRRAEELSTIHRLSKQISVTDNLENILRVVFQEAMRISGADDGGILTFAPNQNGASSLNIAHGIGNTPVRLSKLDQLAINRKETIYISNLNASTFEQEHPGMTSALVVPLTRFGKIVGLLRLFSSRQEKFDQTTQELLQVLCSQTGITLSNLWEYQEATQNTAQLLSQAEALNQLMEVRKLINPESPLEETAGVLANAVRSACQFKVALIYIYDPNFNMLKPVAISGLDPEDTNVAAEISHPWEKVSELVQPAYSFDIAYYIPKKDANPNFSLLPDFAKISYTIPAADHNAWMPGDQLFVPMFDGQNGPLGIILLDAPVDGAVPSGAHLETLELFASELALVIERHATVAALHDQIDAIEAQIVQAQEQQPTVGESPNLSMLLQKDLEQTIALQQLYHRARNIRVGLDIADQVNRQPDRQSVLDSLASQMLTEMELDIALVVEAASGGPRLVGQFGPLPEGANPQALLGQRNPMRQTMQSGEVIIAANLEESTEWQNTPLLRSLGAQAFISLPIFTDGSVDAAVLAISNTPLGEITREDEQVYELIGSQVSLTLQNLNLLTETRRRLREVNLLLEFSRQLGSLDPNEILNTFVRSVRRVLPHAHGVRIMLWDEEEKALITETSAGYTDSTVLGKITHHLGTSIIGRAFQNGETLNISEVDFATDFDLSADNLLRYREATGGRLPVSLLLIPIRATETTQGIVELDNFNTVSAFSEEDQALIESLTQQIALALENARLYAESRRINEELEQRVAERTQELAREHQFTQILLKISTELSSSLDLDMVLNRSLTMLNEATGAEQCNILIARPPEPDLVYRAGAGIHGSPPMGGGQTEQKVEEGIAGWVFQNQQAVIVDDLVKAEQWVNAHHVNPVYRSTLSVPLIVGQDALGCLMLFHRQPGHFSDSLVDAIQAAANQFAVTINNGELFQLIRDQAEDLGNMLRAQQIEASRSTAMLEGVGDGVLVTDSSNVITLFNDAAENMLDLPRAQVLGKSLDEFVGLFGGAARSWMETIHAWSANLELPESTQMYEERLDLEDGRVLSVHLSSVSDRQEFLGTISIFRDITHQVEVDRLKSEFVATVSHELRTPMTPIKGYVEFLLMGGAGELSPQQHQFMSIIKTNIDRLSVLVDDLLDVSRIEAGKVALSFQPIDLNEVIESAVQTILQQSNEDQRPVVIDTHISEDLASIYGDPERVRQIVTNLVDNAYKYSPEDSKITIKVTTHNGNAQIDISDQGIGIFPDEQDKIFERFYRGENHLVMSTAGTGLGLSIVKELIEMHNGRIWVRSSGVPGEGSTFSFTLPLFETEKETIPTASRSVAD